MSIKMKRTISLFLLLVMLVSAMATAAFAATAPAYNGPPTDSLVDSLKWMGIDSSYAFRKWIAAANGIFNYHGSADQNIYLLGLLRAGTLQLPDPGAPTYPAPVSGTPFPAYNGPYTVSIVDALKWMGINSSYIYRSQIAAANGIVGYHGTAWQNTVMLQMLAQGTLIAP